MVQRLRERGYSVREFAFTQQSVSKLAIGLHTLIRAHLLEIPADEALIDELANVRLRETSPGVYRLDHDSGRHADRAISLALAANALLETESRRPLTAMNFAVNSEFVSPSVWRVKDYS